MKNIPNELLEFYRTFEGKKILIKYEDLLANPELLFVKLNEHFEKELSRKEILKLGFISANKQLDNKSHRRSGHMRQYKDILSETLQEKMERNWYDFLNEFGYECNYSSKSKK